MEPLVKVLKLVDQDKKPTLSIIYEAMDRAKLAIKASVKQWEKYWEVIDRRWEGQLHRHLHAAAYFLNPMFQYSKHFSNHPEIKVGLKEVIKRLEPDLDRQAKAINEMSGYEKERSLFYHLIIWIGLDKGLPLMKKVEKEMGSRRGGGTSGGNRGVGGTSEGTGGDGSTGAVISNHHRIDEHLQNLGIGSRPYFRGRDIQILEHELVTHMDMINLLVAVALLIEVLDTIKLGVDPEQPSKPYFPDYGSSSQSSHHHI
ncbi:hypothetical protein CK203_052802 [Vitis vinifera]|uniref:Uncharacterized protein n=1 Tax=Vitis vinifera TaxID=29760 RepID=A0A438GUX1_VITVI|nr:hypothetical protein CK203_052802 [Vitis vinifera]